MGDRTKLVLALMLVLVAITVAEGTECTIIVNASETVNNTNETINKILKEQTDQFDASRTVNYRYIAFRDETRKHKSSGLDWIWDHISWIVSGYGRRPIYTVGVSAFVILFFAIIYFDYYQNDEKLAWRSISAVISALTIIILFAIWFTVFIDELWLLCYIVAVILMILYVVVDRLPLWFDTIRLSAAIFFSAPIDKDRVKDIKGPISSFAVIERALGWLLLAIFIVALNNVVI